MKKIKWTQKEVEHVRNLYLNDHPIKVIARLLNRTPTSVNKAISRFGMRQRRPAKDPSLYIRKIRKLDMEDLLEKVDFDGKWVSLEFAIAWLKERGVNIQKQTCPVTGHIHYSIGSARFTSAGLVIHFNKMRMAEGLKICWVEDVSC